MLTEFLQEFRDDEDGSMAIELLLVTPILVWALLSTFVYFDLFRVESNSNRAALTMADMFSREAAPITPAYLNGAREVLRALTFEEANPDYRVTVYRYRETQDDYRRVWSKRRGLGAALSNSDLADLKAADRLPLMANNDQAILFETRTEYDAPFSIGLGPFSGTDLDDVTFQTFIVIRPREGRLCWDQDPDDGLANQVCGP
ncbi:TadE/TadG family type IV pilus assembly protein [Loktanella sp. Alg231-35]|uniref:TadE/TadG family type IV pilus assembly protein n=1 Tax=Loktanella sp. Alg231-35 TaxID=1922220 RepID=UPI000D55E657|nr:hypothetical protein [Loktanella sp. Alg231-35]